MRLVSSVKLTAIAIAVVCVVCAMTATLKTAAADTLYYNPVVEVVGNGSGALTSAGWPVAIDVFQNSTSGQLSPTSSAAFGSTDGSSMVNSGNSTSEGAWPTIHSLRPWPPWDRAIPAPPPTFTTPVTARLPGPPVWLLQRQFRPRSGRSRVTGGVASHADHFAVATPCFRLFRRQYSRRGGCRRFGYPNGPVCGRPSGSWRNYMTSTQVGTPSNVRTVQASYGSSGIQLFGSSDTGSTVGISVINLSTSTSSLLVQSATTSSNASPYAFVLLDNTANPNTINGYNTAYIADDGTATSEVAGNAGIEKWTYSGSVWTHDYTLLGLLPTGGTATGYRGLAGQMDGGGSDDVILYTTDASSTYLQQVTDPIAALTNPGDTFITLATAPTNEVFRGVALAPAAVPEPSTLALLTVGAVALLGCTIVAAGAKS